TTKSNISSHYQAIPLASVAESIRDVALLCRGLKPSHLWVDTLCLIQDDKDCCLQYSVEMPDIYQNSYLTIAAEEPSSCKFGFLGSKSVQGL
ncbi:hypothetical protein BJ875DRAFT_513129, partial [Amylocarpus encephaloides]